MEMYSSFVRHLQHNNTVTLMLHHHLLYLYVVLHALLLLWISGSLETGRRHWGGFPVQCMPPTGILFYGVGANHQIIKMPQVL